MNSLQALILTITLLQLVILLALRGSKGLSCRTLSMTHILIDKALTNHTIRTIKPITDSQRCRIQCYLEPFCMTYNFCDDQQGNSLCELTNSDHVRHELIVKAGCTYYGSKNHCSSNPCSYNATCQGDFLSDPVPYKCLCPSGYKGDNCEQDINECIAGTHDCHVHATCNNTIGGFNCTCKTGFLGNGRYCEDIDECASGTHDCHFNATCNNTIGWFNCTCKTGFHGNGKDCEDIDECTSGTHNCHVNATCNNTIGGFNCTCKIGFQGNGRDCEDIDECISGTHNCHLNATCSNSIGSFNCSCKQGHRGNGIRCCHDLGWEVIFDFESGGKDGWTLNGTAFNNQPTYGDNSADRGKPSNLQGDWWIGSFENRPSPSHTSGRGQGDEPTGTMTSPYYIIQGSKLRFRIGGGCTLQHQRAELLIGENVVAQETGGCSEYMNTRYWDVKQYQGQRARVRLVDNYSGGWGHINFDYLQGHRCIFG